ncbi:hypothetical protein PhaeoP97_01754 [Phaeobacter porticola]|uniref:Uncharacterized protein n=1 Tax=Phaeobacter porticola TaxID=1844006 RepID=A0A1L3I505_9RHOB|nr:hypothetical protein PhaeoP97_01754 [Phaeobacter porticola]
MGAPSIVFWFKDFQLTQNGGGALPDGFQNGHRYTSLVGLAMSVGSSVPNGASGCWQPNSDIRMRPATPSLQTRRIPPDFPRADLQASSAGQVDAAPRSKVRDAQIETFAKS